MKKINTKKIILAAVITVGLFTAASAQSAYDNNQSAYDDQTYSQPSNDQQYAQQPTTQQYAQQPTAQQPVADQQSFYYYPDANVYFDPSCGQYMYNNGGAWLSVNVLPRNIYIGNSPRVVVYHNGPRVWMDNAIHFNNYHRDNAYRAPVAYSRGFNGGYRNDNFQRGFDRNDNFQRGFNNNRGGFRGANHRR